MQNSAIHRPDADRFQKITAIETELRSTLPWLWAPAFKIGRNEGYDGETFGARAGPSEAMSAKNVIHEVCHCAEITLLPSRVWKRRVRQPYFEMRIRSYQTIGGERYYEPVTMQATERECRVGGMQLRLLEAGGYETRGFVESFALTLKYMSDWYMGGDCPLNAHDPEKYTEEQQKWLDARIALVRAAYDEYPLADIQERWSTAMTWLEKAK